MTEGYVDRRRQYVSQIRNSFDTQEKNKPGYMEEDTEAGAFSFQKLQLMAAGFLLLLFLFLKVTGMELYGYHAEEIIDIVSDNHYYTILQDYVMMEKPDLFPNGSATTSAADEH